jgi:hypothetical protein
VVFIPASVYMKYYVHGFLYVETFLHLLYKTYLVMACDHFDMLLNVLCQYFVENLCIYVH